MSILGDAKEAVELVKKMGNIELLEKLVNIRSELVELTEERNKLKEENVRLNERKNIEKFFVNANGLNKRPSTCSSVNTGRKEIVIINNEKNKAGPTSLAAARIIS